jgi:hypothetical protein
MREAVSGQGSIVNTQPALLPTSTNIIIPSISVSVPFFGGTRQQPKPTVVSKPPAVTSVAPRPTNSEPPGKSPACTTTAVEQCWRSTVCNTPTAAPTAAPHIRRQAPPLPLCKVERSCTRSVLCEAHDNGVITREMRIYAVDDADLKFIHDRLPHLGINPNSVELVNEGTGDLWIDFFATQNQTVEILRDPEASNLYDCLRVYCL